MRCSSCGREVPDVGLLCGCGAFIDRHAVAPDPTLVLPTPSAPTAAAPPPEPAAAPVRCSEPSCVFEVPPGLTSCLLGHPVVVPAEPPRGTVELVLPGGARVALSEGVPVEIGRRSSDERVAASLAAFDAVSRRHAVIVLEGNSLRVRHVGTTNPTWANQRHVTLETVVPLPVELQLGQKVKMTVTRGNR